MRVLVCGGRDFNDRELVFRVLDRLHAWREIENVIQGGATGADRLTHEWARERATNEFTFMANWKNNGVGAGPIRNQRMLDEGKPDLVVAFPGGRGTKDMVERARKVTAVVVIAENGHRATYLAPDRPSALLALKASRIVLGDTRP